MKTTVALHSKFKIFCSTCIMSHTSYWWGSARVQWTCAYRSRAPETVFTALVIWHWHKLLRILKLLKNHIQRGHHTGKQVLKWGSIQRVCCWVGCFVGSTGCTPWRKSPSKHRYKRTHDRKIYIFTQNTVCFRSALALFKPNENLQISEVELQNSQWRCLQNVHVNYIHEEEVMSLSWLRIFDIHIP